MKYLAFVMAWVIMLCGCQPFPASHEYQETQFLFDTVCTLRIGGENPKAAADAAFSVLREIADRVNLYDAHSTVSAVNRGAADTPINLDEHTEAMVSAALEIGAASGGALTITVAPITTLWPFHGEESPTPPDDQTIQDRLEYVDDRLLTLDQEAHTLTKAKDGVAIDLGAVAKGYAADIAVRTLQENGASWGILDLGGNIAVWGKNPSKKDGSWQIGLQIPFAPSGSYAQTVSVTERGFVVSSGTYQRYFMDGETLYHHIIDPGTGYPAKTETDGVSVVADTGLLADCLSTACLILGQEAGTALAAQYGAAAYYTNGKDRKNDE